MMDEQFKMLKCEIANALPPLPLLAVLFQELPKENLNWYALFYCINFIL